MNEKAIRQGNLKDLERLGRQHGKAAETQAEATKALNKEYGIKPPKYDPPAKGRGR